MGAVLEPVLWITILACANTVECSPNSNYQFKETKPTKQECVEQGLDFLRQSSKYVFKNHVITCVEGFK